MPQSVFYGRGGAGNHVSAHSSPADCTMNNTLPIQNSRPRPPVSNSSQSSTSSIPAHSTHHGRGGAGNVAASNAPQKPIGYPPTAIFPFDEELELHDRRFANPAPIYRLGRGGAGNVAHASESNCPPNYYQHVYTASNNILQLIDDDEGVPDECVSLAGSSVSSTASTGGEASTPPMVIRHSQPQRNGPQPSNRQGQKRGGWKAWGL